MKELRLSAFLLLITPALGAAQTPSTSSPENCATLSADIERLACYDAFYRLSAKDTEAADAAARNAAASLSVQNDDTIPAPLKPLTKRLRRWNSDSDNTEILPLDEERKKDVIANAGRGSLLDSRWELANDSKFGVFNLRAYKPIYALPVFWAAKTNALPDSPNPNNRVTEWQNQQPIEGKFQLSFKTKIAENIFGNNGDLWGAYTQTSRWQMYNSEASRPFRETNYEPELMLTFRNRYHLGGWNGRMAGISINHQSNGQSDPRSRSWNRIIGTIGLDRENWALVVRPWWRVSEGEKEDNNADIEDYIGRADAMLVYLHGEQQFTATARHSLRSGDRSHGSLQLDWGFPLDRALRGHIQIFSGYGESLIDYNHNTTYIGLGISLQDWF